MRVYTTIHQDGSRTITIEASRTDMQVDGPARDFLREVEAAWHRHDGRDKT